jgi:copper transport protein
MRRLVVALVAATALAVFASGAASGHALLVSADPAPNSSVAKAPATITLTFTESPDPKLSSVQVLDSGGRSVSTSAATTVPGSSDELRVSVGSLPDGVYTVAWRTVSSVDGHIAAGSYAFAVGSATVLANGTTGGSSAAGTSQGVGGGSALTILGRWLLFLGLLGLVGGGIVGALLDYRLEGAGAGESAILRLAAVELLVGVVGTLLLLAGQISDSGAAIADIPGTTLGRDVLLRLGPLPFAAVFLALEASSKRRGTGPAAHPWLLLSGIAAAAALLIEAYLSHATSEALPVAEVLFQWFHLVAVGLWLGGLVVLLLQIRGGATKGKADIARRFANLAGLGLAAVVVTGLIRAIVEIGTLDALVSTDFGRLVLIKVALLLPLAGLGALNHFRNVPGAIANLGPLRRTGSVEITLGTIILLVAAILVNLAPPAEVQAAQAAPAVTPGSAPLVASGSDFATTVRLKLEVSPGVVGLNTFRATLVDYDTGKPIDASALRLSFSIPSRPDLGASTLTLTNSGNGVFTGSGANLSLEGTWRIAAFVTEPTSSAEIDLSATVHSPPEQIDVNRVPGLPTLYTVHLGSGQTVQIYLDPGTPGDNLLHATWFGADGHEMPVSDVAMSEVSPSSATLTPQILDSGHEAAPVNVASLPATFEITATGPGGSSFSVRLQIDKNS